jgi:hypothetical protein
VLEVLIAVFRIMESNFELVRLQRSALAGPAPAPPPADPLPPSAPPPPLAPQ